MVKRREIKVFNNLPFFIFLFLMTSCRSPPFTEKKKNTEKKTYTETTRTNWKRKKVEASHQHTTGYPEEKKGTNASGCKKKKDNRSEVTVPISYPLVPSQTTNQHHRTSKSRRELPLEQPTKLPAHTEARRASPKQ